MNRISQTVPYQYDTGFSPYKVGQLDRALEDLERYGFTGVEYAVAYPDRVDAEEMNRKTQRHHLAVTTLSTGQIFGLEGAHFTSAHAGERAMAQEIINGQIDLSRRIGDPPVTLGLIRGRCQGKDKEALWKLFRESVLPCVEYAARKGVRLQIEPICKAETGLINSTSEGLRFLEDLGNPAHVGLLYDVYHSYLEDGGAAGQLKAIELAGGRIFNVHFADSNRGLPGTGDIDFPAVYQAILHTGYQGAFALENQCVPSAEYVLENYARAMMAVVK